MTFFAIDIEHKDKSISKCLINLERVIQVNFNDKIGKITTVGGFTYNLGRPDIDRLLKVMKQQKLITVLDFPIIKLKNHETNN